MSEIISENQIRVLSRLSKLELRKKIRQLQAKCDAMQEVVEAAKGLNFGEDWNNGTHAKIYKPKLREALSKPNSEDK